MTYCYFVRMFTKYSKNFIIQHQKTKTPGDFLLFPLKVSAINQYNQANLSKVSRIKNGVSLTFTRLLSKQELQVSRVCKNGKSFQSLGWKYAHLCRLYYYIMFYYLPGHWIIICFSIFQRRPLTIPLLAIADQSENKRRNKREYVPWLSAPLFHMVTLEANT